MVSGKRKKHEEGQAFVEYMILLTMIIGIYLMMSRALGRMDLGQAMLRPIKTDYVKAYKYGHPQAEGPDEGGPKKHPRFSGEGSFRLFINPVSTGGS